MATPPLDVKTLVTQRQPSFYALQPFKHALADELGGEAAVERFAEHAGYSDGWRAESFALASLLDFARSDALQYDAVASSRELMFRPPPVLGRGEGESRRMRTRELFFCALEDVVVSCKSNILLVPSQGLALVDYQDAELAQIPFDLDVDPVVFAPTEERITAYVGRGAFGHTLDRALDLTGLHSFNFGHWLVELLPKLLVCLDRPGFESVTVVVDEQMPQQHREALELLLRPGHPVVSLGPGEALRVRELWTCSTLMYAEIGTRPGEPSLDEVLPLDGDAFNSLVGKLEPLLLAAERPGTPKQIYLARKDSQHKRLVNRAEAEEWFRQTGFDVYEPASLSFAEQLARVRGAEVVAGPEGSGLWLAFWARPGTKIAVLDSPYVDQWWPIVDLCRARGLELSILVGEVVRHESSYVKFSDYEIDLTQLPAFVAR